MRFVCVENVNFRGHSMVNRNERNIPIREMGLK